MLDTLCALCARHSQIVAGLPKEMSVYGYVRVLLFPLMRTVLIVIGVIYSSTLCRLKPLLGAGCFAFLPSLGPPAQWSCAAEGGSRRGLGSGVDVFTGWVYHRNLAADYIAVAGVLSRRFPTPAWQFNLVLLGRYRYSLVQWRRCDRPNTKPLRTSLDSGVLRVDLQHLVGSMDAYDPDWPGDAAASDSGFLRANVGGVVADWDKRGARRIAGPAWLYNSTEGSLLIVHLFHAASNTTLGVLPILPMDTGGQLRPLWIAVGLLWVVAVGIVVVNGPVRLSRRRATDE